ncbi:D-arabinono-1,4-lactone oxidase [Actinomarinicola tropica]|uniref:FAD-binding protein n=1 Tax=Actinomarinicola tropica TaxID=2789776 RepID=A0A5Q2RMH5_9ACTN|nr:D-arabinono-1,4-lactone oxidase [Actinomarinicola tropica]QGG95070.1 FAD-binding protein [Actinomarinicola tropica]
MPEWSNWSGLVRSTPERLVRPSSEEEVVAAVRDAATGGLTVRIAGSGHSFTRLVATDDAIVALDGLTGVVDVDPEAGESGEAELWAGTPIHAVGPLLHPHGVALRNQGDIDRQALAGACGTGTHGTGPSLTSFSGAVVGATLVLASGDVVSCDADHEPDLFRASRLSLGASGVVTRLRLAVRPSYRLHEREWAEPVDDALARLDDLIAATRHFEFFWFPGGDQAWCKALDETDAEPDELPDVDGERIDDSWAIYPSDRDDRFNEMEYAVPAEKGPACFQALRELYRTRHPDTRWPIEYRTQAADDVWMSPAHGRPTVTLSIHEPVDRDHEPLFRDAEEIFRAFDGRPHWGKLSYLDPSELPALVPGWDEWWAARDAADPDGVFLNDHLRRLAGR